MNLKALLTPGVIAGILAFVGTVLTAAGKPAVGAFFNDPATAANVQHGIDAILAVYAGFAQGVLGKTPAPPAA